ncbi:hypothetical protein ZEAMMB73_Zm00001d019252 [Zea mays]|uniref:Uncharacterized protein n=1 Tax=Zea mays TaxID=4577 RepID=A0A1D6HWG4_MAIZE|nr:hypothetical protein ZEAMMB73_Zm00001d019252 [Zea mays]
MFVAGAIMGYIMFIESTVTVHTELTPKSCGFQDCSLDYDNCSFLDYSSDIVLFSVEVMNPITKYPWTFIVAVCVHSFRYLTINII